VRARAAEAGALGALLAAGTYLFTRAWDAATSIDEGVYLASARELRHGASLGGDVFASQPPPFYWLLRAGATLGGDSLHGLRATMLVVSLAGVLAAWWIGRELYGPLGGLGAAGALVIAPPYADEALRVQSDSPSVAAGLLATAVLLAATRRRSPALYALAGGLFALAVGIKLLALPLLAMLALLALRRPTTRALVALAGGAALVAAIAAASVAGSLGAVWHDAVAFHAEGRNTGPWLGPNLHRVFGFPDLHTPFGLVVLPVGAAASLVLRTAELGVLWLTAAAAAVFLVLQNPLLDHHMVLLAATLAVPAGAALGGALARLASRPRTLGVAGAVLVIAAGAAQAESRVRRNADPEPAYVRWAISVVRAHTTPGAPIPADLPQVPYLAGRRVPPALADPSLARTEDGDLSRAEIVAAVREAHSPVVVVGRAFLTVPGLYGELRRMYPVHRERRGAIVLLKR
jgi:4-amino-4-deoxy-L-arabinose transferase-like glycosyltransferase